MLLCGLLLVGGLTACQSDTPASSPDSVSQEPSEDPSSSSAPESVAEPSESSGSDVVIMDGGNEEALDAWLQKLDPAVTCGASRSGTPVKITLYVVDSAAFGSSPHMAEAKENGYNVELVEVRYSTVDIDAALEKLFPKWDTYGVTGTAVFVESNSVEISTTDLSDSNKQAIIETLGLEAAHVTFVAGGINPDT